MDLDLTAAGFCGVVLAGGTAARMGGIDKGSVEVGGRTLLEIAIDAFLDANGFVSLFTHENEIADPRVRALATASVRHLTRRGVQPI